MKKHFWRILTVLLMACLGMGVLAACGDGEEPEGPPAPPAEANPYEGIWTGASATDFIMSGTQTVSAAVDFVEGQAHEGYVVATITGNGANAETYYAAFGIDKDGETYKGDLFFGDDTVEVTLSLANNQLKAVVPSFEEGEDPTTLTFTSRNATLPAAISPTGTLYGSDEFADTIFTYDFTNKKFYIEEAEQVAKFVNVANYVVIETEQGEGEDAFTACLIVYQKGTAYHCNGIGDDMELSTTKPVPAPRYSVTYDDGDADGAAKNMPPVNESTYHKGEDFQLYGTEPQWEGHDFEGWKASTDQQTYDAGALYTFTDSDVTFTAQWSTSTPTATYTVQFVAGGHGTVADGEVTTYTDQAAAAEVDIPAAEAFEGYTFDGWFKEGDTEHALSGDKYTVAAEDDTDNDGTITITAKFTAKTYNVTLNVGANGTLAGGAETTVTATYDQSVTLPDVTANKGYTFKGWYTEATAGTQVLSGGTWSIDDDDATLYAQYDYIEYTVEYVKGNVDGDPTGMPTDASITVSLADNNNKFTLPTTEPTLTDHVFDGWKLGTRALGKTNTEITITAADLPENDAAHKLTVTATWHEEGKLSVTYELGDHAAADQSAPTQADVASGTQIDLPDAPTAAKGYRFDAWYVKDTSGSNTKAGNPQGKYEVVGDANVTIIAKYVAIKYTVKFEKGEGTVEGTIDNVADFTVEGEINLVEKIGYTRTGYTLTGWKSGSTTLNANETFKLSEHPELIPTETEDNTGVITLTAQWTAKTYTITLNVAKPAGDKLNGEITGDYEDHLTQTVSLESTEITLPTLSLVGYTFGGWLKGGEAFTATTFTADMIPAESDTIELTAKWDVISYTITFAEGKPEGAGNVTGMPDSEATVTAESIEATLETPELDGYTFTGWKLDGTHTFNDKFTLTAELIGTLQGGNTAFALTATWTQLKYKVTYDAGECSGATGIPEDDTEYTYNGKANIKDGTPTYGGYTFEGWTVQGGDDTVYKYNDETHGSYTITGNVTFIAKWTPKSYTLKFYKEKGQEPDDGYTKTVTGRAKAELPSGETTKTNYKFEGWFLEDGTQVDENFEPWDHEDDNEGSTTFNIYAKWTFDVTIGTDDNELGYTVNPLYSETLEKGHIISWAGTMTSKAESNWQAPVVFVYTPTDGTPWGNFRIDWCVNGPDKFDDKLNADPNKKATLTNENWDITKTLGPGWDDFLKTIESAKVALTIDWTSEDAIVVTFSVLGDNGLQKVSAYTIQASADNTLAESYTVGIGGDHCYAHFTERSTEYGLNSYNELNKTSITLGKDDNTTNDHYIFMNYIQKGEKIVFEGEHSGPINLNWEAFGVGLGTTVPTTWLRSDNFVDGATSADGDVTHDVAVEGWHITKTPTAGDSGNWATTFAEYIGNSTLKVTLDWTEESQIKVTFEFADKVTTSKTFKQEYVIAASDAAQRPLKDRYNFSLGVTLSHASLTATTIPER